MGNSIFDVIERLIKAVFSLIIFLFRPFVWIFKKIGFGIDQVNWLNGYERKRIVRSKKTRNMLSKTFKTNNEI